MPLSTLTEWYPGVNWSIITFVLPLPIIVKVVTVPVGPVCPVDAELKPVGPVGPVTNDT
jgi:hypothetical protein